MILDATQILALAPDPASAKAGGQLATPAKWSGLGRSEGALWGECQGSGKNPYRTQIDLGGSAFKCSCPSRKFPCKHGIALYLLLAGQPSLFATADTPEWVGDWLRSRQAREEKKAEKESQRSAPANPGTQAAAEAQARKREEKREDKVSRGLSELRTWLDDLAREGLASGRARGQGAWDAVAARLIDAQAGTLSRRLRRAGSLYYQGADEDRDGRLAREMASIYLLATAWQRLDQLPVALQYDVRSAIGWSIPVEDVLQSAPVSDQWQVLAQTTTDEDKLKARSTWLRGVSTGRWAQLLQYSVGTQGFEHVHTPGTAFNGELCFYPGAYPLRAAIRNQAAPAPMVPVFDRLDTLDAALDACSQALAVQPFLDRYPLVLRDAVLDAGDRRRVHCPAGGAAIALHPSFRHWLHIAAISGGHPTTLIGEWDGHAFMPLSVWHAGRLYNIESDLAA
ncbi:SWIM zinc finger family protein [Massilia terrae]|uniref:SWIM zinc finger family protein n=1 Tax=Massilia terrae TaxID=1811224 RepID=A0ABT2D4Q4_9BURK|nr:SWIM zinc finger family protein [Massilia terrae]MCS0661224.1 SWIM zinc finger family protein [Massilia terrae]